MFPFRKAKPFFPVLTFPPAEADLVTKAYGDAKQILEYGSGGSTALAASLGRPVVSVESDRAWALSMEKWLAGEHPEAEARILSIDIGPTKSWGRPRNDTAFRSWPLYPYSVWDDAATRPDLVLIDGRFRVACLCATWLRTKVPVRVLFDDFTGREEYASVVDVVKPTRIVGRMAEFHLNPGAFPMEQLTWAVRQTNIWR